MVNPSKDGIGRLVLSFVHVVSSESLTAGVLVAALTLECTFAYSYKSGAIAIVHLTRVIEAACLDECADLMEIQPQIAVL